MQVALGAIWIIAAALQLQPKMFGSFFPQDVIARNAVGQPAFIGPSIAHMANFLSHDVALWNGLFAVLQLGVGVGLLLRRSVKPALAVSFVWALGVWWFGEGLGGIFTGGANALMGAPGAVLLYALIGLLVWPRSEPVAGEASSGIGSSVAGRGPLGPMGALGVWAALWSFFALLQLLPQNRTSGWLQGSLAGMASGEPGWYAHFLNSMGNAFIGAGTPFAVILASLFVVIAVGPVVTRRPDVFVFLGMGIAALFWVTGQAFGGVLTGTATDVNSAPLLILLGVAYLPLVLAPAGGPVPVQSIFSRRPVWAIVGIVSLSIVPVAVAVVPDAPVAAAASGTTSGSHTSAPASMPGMTMSAAGGSGGSGGGGSSMNMSAMAGLGVTEHDWRYTGPALPSAEVSLLNSVGATADQGHQMQTPSCSIPLTSAQILGVTQYVQATSAAVSKYAELSAATAAGYIPVTSLSYPIVHYVNLTYMQNQNILNPDKIDSLVYAFTPQGPVLVAAMYLMRGMAFGPMPYGCLVQWHAHTNLCTSDTTKQIVGFTPCAPGTHHGGRTGMMTHVWQVPVAGGPLALDPTDLQVVEAAVMAQQEGLAPTTPGFSGTFGANSSFNSST